MTTEEKAQALAEAFARAENRLRNLAEAAKNYADAVRADPAVEKIGPVTEAAIVGQIQGALGLVATAHLAVTPYDVRPQVKDGGGGK